MRTDLTATAPGKLILSGEHSIIYGQPAIAIAVDRMAEAKLIWRDHHSISFHLMNLSYTKEITLKRLRNLKHRIQKKYLRFLNGECTIGEVLQKSFELMQYVFIHLIDRLNINLPHGLEMKLNSNIPIGCGMGSSAATIASVIHAINSFLELDMQLENYLQIGKDAENLQHGNTSGLDLYMSIHGGCAKFVGDQIEIRPLPKIPLYFVNTGMPKATTGECIVSAAKHFHDEGLTKAFAAATDAFGNAMQKDDISAIGDIIRANHKLLLKIGVVPKKVQNFINDVEKTGSAAKICGAGSVRGQNAGIVIVLTKQNIDNIAKKYGYTVSKVIGNSHGLRLL